MRAAVLAAFVAVAATGWASAQGTEIGFGDTEHDSSLPVEVTSDTLSVDQSDGSAVFTGNVVVAQGEMRLSAPVVRVVYVTGPDGAATSDIERMEASEGVTIVNGAEAAEGREAVYTIESGNIVLTGDVILTQVRNAISGDKLTVNLTTGKGVMEGRVKTILQSGSGN